MIRGFRLPDRRSEAGYAAVLVAILVPTVFMGLAAVGVDTARWYVEIERVQRAADAAALSGVTYMPADLPTAQSTALATAARNGYVPGTNTTIVVEPGARASQLKVTISTVIHNTFGATIGVPTARITRHSVADYTGPAPMGSPCNTFGNEPPSNALATTPKPSGSALPSPGFANCSSNPKFWALIQGPATGKTQGDRYSTRPCGAANVSGCSSTSSSATNVEYKEEGYYFVVHVRENASAIPSISKYTIRRSSTRERHVTACQGAGSSPA